MTTTVSHPKHFFLLTDLQKFKTEKKDNVAHNHNVIFFKFITMIGT
jgi:hypothetical protein